MCWTPAIAGRGRCRTDLTEEHRALLETYPDSRILALTFRLSSQISHISPYISKTYTPKPSSLEKRKNGPLVTLGKLVRLVGLKTVEAYASHVSAQGGNTAEADASHVSVQGRNTVVVVLFSFCSFKLGHVKTLVQPGPASYFVKL